eukprot:TRINITY_DN3826_c0_g1_i1.p1 TRINITY_DN3826_c0_g1~~TRINITY_DN3826_c0_g1_i1.p1  ORF type:complete len:209 (-),score=62.59 TRINITY_DN3826_c0_g1_i1:147-773(-)
MAPSASESVTLTPLRLVLVGSGGVGKSAFAVRFLEGRFIESYNPTIEDSHSKEWTVDGQPHLLELLDTAGQEEYSALRDHLMKTGQGFLLLYSIDSVRSFEMAINLRNQILRIKESYDVPIILVANKSDLEADRAVGREEGKIIAQKWGCQFVEASAKDDVNVSEVFSMLVRQTTQHLKTSPSSDKSVKRDRQKRYSLMRKNDKCCLM